MLGTHNDYPTRNVVWVDPCPGGLLSEDNKRVARTEKPEAVFPSISGWPLVETNKVTN